MEWERPPERICELLRQGATTILNNPQAWLDELDEAILSAANMEEVAADPVLAAGLRRVIRSYVLHWVAANVRDPGAPVSPTSALNRWASLTICCAAGSPHRHCAPTESCKASSGSAGCR